MGGYGPIVRLLVTTSLLSTLPIRLHDSCCSEVLVSFQVMVVGAKYVLLGNELLYSVVLFIEGVDCQPIWTI